MKNSAIWKRILWIVLAMLLLSACACAEAPEDETQLPPILTVTAKEPTEETGWHRFLLTYNFCVDCGNGPEELKFVTRYAHYGPIYADGMVFQDAFSYVSNPRFGEIREADWHGALAMTLALEETVEANCGWTLWRYEENRTEQIKTQYPVAEELGEGRYLLMVDLNVSGEDAEFGPQYFRGTAFLWLNVTAEETAE